MCTNQGGKIINHNRYKPGYFSFLVALLVGLSSLVSSQVILAEGDLVNPTDEAKMISAFLDDQLLWDPEKAQEVDQELREIRNYLERYNPAAVNLSFRPMSQWGKIVVRLSREAASSVRKGEGGPWDSLNSRLGIEVDRIEWLLDRVFCSLHFKEPLNPRHLVELYEGLPGVESVSVNGILYTPWGPSSSGIFPMEQKGRRTYIVVYEKREANGRTLNTEYWHFSAKRGVVVFLDYWSRLPGDPHPPWIATVEKARDFAKTH